MIDIKRDANVPLMIIMLQRQTDMAWDGMAWRKQMGLCLLLWRIIWKQLPRTDFSNFGSDLRIRRVCNFILMEWLKLLARARINGALCCVVLRSLAIP